MKTTPARRLRLCQTIVISLIVAYGPNCVATVIFDNFDIGGGHHATANTVAGSVQTSFGITNIVKSAARFTVSGGDYYLNSVTLPISVQNNVSGDHFRVRLDADVAGSPGYTLEILSENQNVWPSFSNPFTSQTTVLSTIQPLLTNGQNCWIVTEITSIPSGTNVTLDYRWFYNTNGTTVPFRSDSRASFADAWNGGVSPNNVAFRIEGTLSTAPPVITQQPISLSVFEGRPASLSALAEGAPPLSFQWYLNGVPVTQGTNSNLDFLVVARQEAGTYFAVISNSYGAVTSAPISLSVSNSFNVWLFDTNAMPAAQTFIQQQGAVVWEYSEYFERISFYCSTQEFAVIGAQPWVRRAEAAHKADILNCNSRTAIGTIKIQPPPFGNKIGGLDGTGVTMGVWDGGTFDLAHPDFGSRLLIMESCGPAPKGFDKHAKHVIGTAAGDGSLGVGSSVPNALAGMAPAARIQAWTFGGCGNTYTPQQEMSAARTGLYFPPAKNIDLSQNSWGLVPYYGCGIFGSYMDACEEYDRMVHDTGLPIFFAAGNAREGAAIFSAINPTCDPLPADGFGTVVPFGTAKNVVTVGAVNFEDDLCVFSSCGPTLDGRLKPDVVALGENVYSVSTIQGTFLDPRYTLKSGTSMATPAVSGTAALLIQQFRRPPLSREPSPALLKGLLCNTATDLGNPGPDFKYGYGKVDAVKAVDTITAQQFEDVSGGLSTGGVWTRQITNDAGCDLRVMVTWSDAPYEGSNQVKTLINDLDLVLIDPSGNSHLPLTLNPDAGHENDPATAGRNGRDNVEQVVIPGAAGGVWTIRVIGYDVPSNDPQRFAVVWNFSCPSACGSLQPIPGLFNSGMAGSLDPHYILKASPPGTAFTHTRLQATPDSSWFDNGPASQWLHPGPDSDEFNGDYVYEMQLDLGCCDPTTAILVGRWMADDWAELRLNGKRVTTVGTLFGFTTWTPLLIDSGFVPGVNKLEFVVRNDGGAPTGLRVEWDTNSCTVCCQSGGSIMGQTFLDLNGNGVKDAFEPPLPNWTIHLPNGQTAVSDVNGNYAFRNLPPANYTVAEFQQAGWLQTAPAAGIYNVTLGAGDCVKDLDFGDRLCPMICPTNVIVECTNDAGNFVDFSDQMIPGATYNPASGSHFSVGVTPVTCTSTDPCGQISTCTFDVIVRRHGNDLGRWLKSNVSGPSTRANAIAVDKSGNSYVAGVFSGSSYFSSQNGFATFPLSSVGGTDGFVAKYDAAGTLLWLRQIAGSGNEVANGVAVDSQGNCCVVGNFEGDWVGFPDAPTLYLQNPGFGGSDIFVVKYAPNGSVLWSKEAGGAGGDVGEGIAVDEDNNCYITGAFSSAASFGAASVSGEGSPDCYLAKCSAGGTFLWAIATSGTLLFDTNGVVIPYSARGRSVAIDNPHKRALITGFFNSNARFGNALPALSYSSGFGNAFVAQADIGIAGPGWTWARQTFCPYGSDYCDSSDGTAIGVDPAGNSYFTAYYHGGTAIGPAPNQQITSTDHNRYFTAVGSFTTDGAPRWLKPAGSTGDDEPRSLAVDQSSGTVYIAGFRNGADVNADGGRNVKLLKINAATGDMGAIQLGDGSSVHSDNAGRGVAVDSAGCVYLAGSYNDTSLSFSGFVDGNHKLSAPPGVTRMFVARYCATCATNCEPAIVSLGLQNAIRNNGVSPLEPLTFAVATLGSPPPAFTWYRGDVLLPASTNNSLGYSISNSADGLTSTLRLTSMPTSGTGSTFSVNVANQCCDCVAVSRASIFYFDLVSATNAAIASPYQFRFGADNGLAYNVEYRDSLNPDTQWQFLTNMVGTGSNAVVIDPNPNPIMRFYRIPVLPDP